MNQEYENPLFLEEWLKSRVKYQKEEEANIQKNKQAVKRIDFSWHNLKGKFVIADFPNLTTLNLGNNSLEEIEIRNCPHLRNIIVSHNQKRMEEEFTFVDEWENTRKYQISKEVGPTLKKLTITDCPAVQELYCSHNALTDLDISQLNQLTALSYSDNELSESKQAELAAKKLPEGNPTGRPFKTFDNDFLLDNEEITEIDISNEAGWEGKLEVKNCPKLTSLVVDNCGLEKLVIEGCPNLKTLSFRFNKVKKIDLTGLDKLKRLYCSDSELEKLDLSNNLKLKHLVCDNNFIEELEVKHLKNLESLYCFRCCLDNLDCDGLSELKELYCANNAYESEDMAHRLSKISTEGCDNLEILDCAENNIGELNISNLTKLKQVSCRENKLVSINASNCVSLEYLDFSSNFCLHTYGYDGELKDDENCSLAVDELILDNCPKLSKVFASESFDYDLTKLPNLRLLRVDDEETDFEAIKNIENIQNVLNNPNDYSIDDIIKLDLYGVPDNLREKLKVLVINKIKAAETSKANFLLTNKQNLSNFLRIIYLRSLNQDLLDQETEDKVIALITKLENQEKKRKTPSPEEDKQNDNPSPKRRKKDKDQIILALQQKIAELEKELENGKGNAEKRKEEIRNEITNSDISEEQKEELLRQLEGLTKKTTNETEISPSTPLYYWGWLFVIVGWIVLVGLFILPLRRGKKRKYK